MPPGLISSAAPGKKAAPKAPARRRPPPQPTAPAPSAQTPAPRPSATPSVAPLSPPPTRPPIADEPPVQHVPPPSKKPQELPVSEPAREPEVELPSQRPQREDRLTPVIDVPLSEKTAQSRRAPTPVVLPTPDSSQAVSEQQTDVVQERETAAEERLNKYNVIQDRAPSSGSRVQEASESGASALVGSSIAQTSENSELVASARSKRASKRSRAEPSNEPRPRATKRAKRTSTRSNFITTTVTNGEYTPANTVDTQPEMEAVESTRSERPQIKAAAAAKRKSVAKSAETIMNSDDEDEGPRSAVASPEPGEEGEEAGEVGDKVAREKARKPRQIRKRKKSQPANGQDGPQEEEEGSDPEAHEVEPTTLSMWEVSHDTRHGKMSERGKAMEAIDWDEVNAKRRAAAELIASGGQQPGAESVVPTTEDANGTAEPQGDNEEGASQGEQPEAAVEDSIPHNPEDGLGFQMDADGNIVLAEDTVTINRDAAATAAAAADRPVEDVNDLTVSINRTTWINENRREATDRVPLWKWKSDPWSEDETDRFYDALCMFGTDFFIISKMFPPKTRRMIKAKFTREERLDPQRINDALSGKNTRRMNLEHYARETARDISVFTRYEGIEHAQAVINESMKERQDAMTTAAEKEAQAEAERREKEKQKAAKKGSRKGGRKAKTATFGGFGGGGPEDGD